MDKMKMKKRLTEKISGSLMQEDAPMAKFTSFRAGGCADLLVQPQNIKELQLSLIHIYAGKALQYEKRTGRASRSGPAFEICRKRSE